MQNKELIVAVGEVLKSERAEMLARLDAIPKPDVTAADVTQAVVGLEAKITDHAQQVDKRLNEVSGIEQSIRDDVAKSFGELADQVKAIQDGQITPEVCAADLDAMAKSFEDGINSLQEALNAKAEELDDANNATLELVGKQLEDLRGEIAKTASLARMVIEQAADATVVKQWSDGVYREGARVSGDIGYEYQALRDTAAEPSPINPDWMVVRRGLRFCGVQSEDSIYFPGDITVKDGAL